MQITNIIFDRDGVINQDSEHYIKSADEFVLINDALSSLIKLHKNNIKIFIATNQSGINRKYYSLDDFFSINQKLLDQLGKQVITAIYYCPHLPEELCRCRKPSPGMINKIMINHQLDIDYTAFIGDSIRDINAAQLAGCKHIFLIKTGNGLKTYNKYREHLAKNVIVFDNLTSCVDYILNLNE